MSPASVYDMFLKEIEKHKPAKPPEPEVIEMPVEPIKPTEADLFDPETGELPF
jgi:hypothetical protein